MACRSCRRHLESLARRTVPTREPSRRSQATLATAARATAATAPTTVQVRRAHDGPPPTRPRADGEFPPLPEIPADLGGKSPQAFLRERLQEGRLGGGGSGGGIIKSLARSSVAAPYRAFAATQTAYKAVAVAAEYGITPEDRKKGRIRFGPEGEEIGVGGGVWHDQLNLPPTFSTWAQVTMLHMYLMVVRLRCMDKDSAKLWQTQLVDHFFHQAEDKMELVHDMASRSVRQRYLRDLFVQWRGVMLAYDEGLVRGDAVLAAAVWRNLFKGRDDVDLRHLAAVVAWMRLALARLDRLSDEVLATDLPGAFRSPPTSELKLVDQPARELAGLFGGKTAA